MPGVAALLAGLGSDVGAGGGTVVPTPAPAWTNIVGVDDGSSNQQVIQGVTGPVTLSAALTGFGELLYTLNGTPYAYGGAFTVRNADRLTWAVSNPLVVSVSGTITVTNVSTSSTLATIPYHIASSGRL